MIQNGEQKKLNVIGVDCIMNKEIIFLIVIFVIGIVVWRVVDGNPKYKNRYFCKRRR